jgi:hypothetical protein
MDGGSESVLGFGAKEPSDILARSRPRMCLSTPMQGASSEAKTLFSRPSGMLEADHIEKVIRSS